MAILTLTASVPQAARFAHAVGVAKNLGRDATLAECTQFLRDYAESVVQQVERNEGNAALVITALGLT